MNTRLQVEHCVTELITGIDLVKEQINVARGQKLSFSQEDLKINGHAIELRVCAEDPRNNFLPDTGKLEIYQTPKGPGVRVDDGYEQGMNIPVYYDPMIAKLVVHGATRDEAIERLCRAIDEYYIKGINTTLGFGKWAVRSEPFRSGNFDTKFIEKHFKPEYLNEANPESEAAAAALAAYLWDSKQSAQLSSPVNVVNNWKIVRK